MTLNRLRGVLGWMRSSLREQRERRQLRDPEWRAACRRHGIPFDRVELAPPNRLKLHLEHASLTFPKTTRAIQVLEGYGMLRDLEAFTRCRADWDENLDMLVLRWGEVVCPVDSFEELLVLHELYFTGTYDFTTLGPTLIVDVGANVGFTSIFLASNNPEAVVVGCEPVPQCFAKASSNLALNPQLAGRVRLHNIALLSADGERTIKSEAGHRVRSSFLIDRPQRREAPMEQVAVKVRRASSFVREVSSRNPGLKLVMKLDCEGSEYEILEDLANGGALELVSGFLMEWHRLPDSEHGVDFVRAFLARAGFDVLLLGRFQVKNETGMAYAFRTAARAGA